MDLTVRSGPDAGASVTIDRRMTIGREAEFRLTDPAVSRQHAAVTPTSDGRVLLEDLGSTGGTVVNGTKLFGPVTLQGGEQIQMGGSILTVVATSGVLTAATEIPVGVAAPPPPTAPVVPPPPTPAPVAPAPTGGGGNRKMILIIVVVLALVAAAVGFVVLTGGDDEPAPPGNATGATGASAQGALAPVSNLAADPGKVTADPTSWTVSLTWDDASAELGLDHYEVSRNGKSLEDDVAEPAFVDEEALPDSEFTYDVVAVGEAGTTEVASITVATQELETDQALVEGRYEVSMRVTKTNLNDRGSTVKMRWEFSPGCEFGSCDLVWLVVGKDASGLVFPQGSKYQGVGTGPFLIRSCFNEPVNEDLTLVFTVQKGEVKGGVFAATTLKGTLREVAKSAGCVTAARTFTFTATRG